MSEEEKKDQKHQTRPDAPITSLTEEEEATPKEKNKTHPSLKKNLSRANKMKKTEKTRPVEGKRCHFSFSKKLAAPFITKLNRARPEVG